MTGQGTRAGGMSTPMSTQEIDALLRKAGVPEDRLAGVGQAGRPAPARAGQAAPGFTAASQRDAAPAREQARRARAEYLLRLSAGDMTIADVILAACTPQMTGPLRKLRLDHVMRAAEHATTLKGIHARLALVHARSGAAGAWCAGPHPRTSPRTACPGFHPQQMTISWLLHPSARGRRLRAWASLYASVWDSYPRAPRPRSPAGHDDSSGEAVS